MSPVKAAVIHALRVVHLVPFALLAYGGETLYPGVGWSACGILFYVDMRT